MEKILKALNVSFEEFFSFESSLKIIKDDSFLEKLIIELADRPDSEVELVYNVAKQIVAYEDKK